MEKYIDMMKQSSSLQDTVHEGLEHIHTLFESGKFEASIPLFGDIVQAYGTIEGSLRVLPDEVVTDEINQLTSNIRSILNVTVTAYEEENYEQVQELFQQELTPSFNEWRKLLVNAFKPYLVS